MKVKNVRRTVVFFMFLIMATGIFWLTFGLLIVKHNKIFDDSMKESVIASAVKMVIGFGSFLILWSFLGFFAVVRRYTLVLGLYNLGVFVLLSISITLLVFSALLASILPEYINDTTCEQKDLLVELHTVNKLSVNSLCQTACQCDFKGTQEEAESRSISNYNVTLGVERIQQCSIYSTGQFDDLRKYGNTMQQVETLFECSGICSVNPYFVFTDVNKARPSADCKVEVLQYLDTHSKYFLKASIGFTCLFAISFLVSCLLCLKKPKGASYFEKDGVGYFANN